MLILWIVLFAQPLQVAISLHLTFLAVVVSCPEWVYTFEVTRIRCTAQQDVFTSIVHTLHHITSLRHTTVHGLLHYSALGWHYTHIAKVYSTTLLYMHIQNTQRNTLLHYIHCIRAVQHDFIRTLTRPCMCQPTCMTSKQRLCQCTYSRSYVWILKYKETRLRYFRGLIGPVLDPLQKYYNPKDSGRLHLPRAFRVENTSAHKLKRSSLIIPWHFN